jgi:hypothetical protein
MGMNVNTAHSVLLHGHRHCAGHALSIREFSWGLNGRNVWRDHIISRSNQRKTNDLLGTYGYEALTWAFFLLLHEVNDPRAITSVAIDGRFGCMEQANLGVVPAGAWWRPAYAAQHVLDAGSRKADPPRGEVSKHL